MAALGLKAFPNEERGLNVAPALAEDVIEMQINRERAIISKKYDREAERLESF